jgi:hypothetical protein
LTWTYSGDPSASNRDKVRFLVHDTDTTRQLITDEEVAWALTDAGGNYYRAAATCCRVIGSEFAQSNVTVGDVAEVFFGADANWTTLAEEYDRKAAAVGSCPSPFLGGASVDRRRDNAADTDRTLPRSWFGQFDDPPIRLTSTSTSQP